MHISLSNRKKKIFDCLLIDTSDQPVDPVEMWYFRENDLLMTVPTFRKAA
jgi:hypothetical protein